MSQGDGKTPQSTEDALGIAQKHLAAIQTIRTNAEEEARKAKTRIGWYVKIGWAAGKLRKKASLKRCDVAKWIDSTGTWVGILVNVVILAVAWQAYIIATETLNRQNADSRVKFTLEAFETLKAKFDDLAHDEVVQRAFFKSDNFDVAKVPQDAKPKVNDLFNTYSIYYSEIESNKDGVALMEWSKWESIVDYICVGLKEKPLAEIPSYLDSEFATNKKDRDVAVREIARLRNCDNGGHS
ncbi:hypothetical protein U8Q07_15040 [Rhizobium ruizarguesonis]|nr:hypothetical protein U8Q07_15040 [Rhizobium ruizarguesonis]